MEVQYSSIPKVKEKSNKALITFLISIALSVGISVLVDYYLRKRNNESGDIY